MDKIYLASPHMSEEGFEKEYIAEAFETNWIAPLGANVTGFENDICSYAGVDAAAALSSGTAALHLAMILSGLKDGDTVICQDLTFSASANPIIYERCTPVFVDSEKETWNISPEALRQAFEEFPEAKAVVAVHLYGIPSRIDEIKDICRENKAVLIEDAAESLGTIYKGQMTGSFGDFGIYSFNGNKIITTSGGGMLVAKGDGAEKSIERARFLSTQAREPFPYYQHETIGYNYRMSNICAGIGRGQMKVLENRVSRKREIYDFYKEAFSGIDDIEMMPIVDDCARSNCWLSCITIDSASAVSKEDVMKALSEKNIESRHIWKPMHLQPVFKDAPYIDNGSVGEDIFARGLCLPSDTKLTDADLTEITDIVKGLWLNL